MKKETKNAGPGFTATDIKKFTYKQKPKAIFQRLRMGVAYYNFPIFVEGAEDSNDGRIIYECEIPVSDMGTADFYPEMEAKHLLRWLSPIVVAFEIVRKEL